MVSRGPDHRLVDTGDKDVHANNVDVNVFLWGTYPILELCGGLAV